MHERTWRLALLAMLAAVLLVASGSGGRAAHRAGHPDPTRARSVATLGLDQGTQPPLGTANEHAPTTAAAAVGTQAKALVEFARRGRALLQEIKERLQRWETELTPRLMALEAHKKRAEETQRRQQQLEQELIDLRRRTEQRMQELTALISRTQLAMTPVIGSWPSPSPTPPVPSPIEPAIAAAQAAAKAVATLRAQAAGRETQAPPPRPPVPPQAPGTCKEALPDSPVALLCAYYADLGGKDGKAAIKKWKTPDETRLQKLIDPIEWFELPQVLLVRAQTSTATVDIEVRGKNKGERPKTWRGTFELEKVDGTWQIVRMKDFTEVKKP